MQALCGAEDSPLLIYCPLFYTNVQLKHGKLSLSLSLSLPLSVSSASSQPTLGLAPVVCHSRTSQGTWLDSFSLPCGTRFAVAVDSSRLMVPC